jgi:hypothetical protein
MKRSNPTRNVPHPAPFGGGGVDGMRSRSDFAGSSSRRLARRTRKRAEWEADTVKRGRIETNNGDTMPDRAPTPRPPPLLVLYQDLADEPPPLPVYGQYPRGLIGKLLPWLRCARYEILHVCSGSLPKGEGIRVDIRPEARPDILADGRRLPLRAGSVAAVMIDPPYCEEYAVSLYGVAYPRPSHLLREAARVVRPGGRIVLVHYITAAPAPGTRFVKALGLSIGFDAPMRAVSIYERDQAELDLGGAA